MLSLGGGTGAGLGSLLVEAIRATFPVHFVIAVTILGFPYGDGPLQPYSITLASNKLQEAADAVLVFQNERLLHSLLSQKSKGDQESIGYRLMNRVIGKSLASLFTPLERGRDSGSTFSLSPCWDIVSTLGSAGLKWVEVFSVVLSKKAAMHPDAAKKVVSALLAQVPRYHSSKQVTLSPNHISLCNPLCVD